MPRDSAPARDRSTYRSRRCLAGRDGVGLGPGAARELGVAGRHQVRGRRQRRARRGAGTPSPAMAKAAAALRHPKVVGRAQNTASTAGLPYLLMEQADRWPDCPARPLCRRTAASLAQRRHRHPGAGRSAAHEAGIRAPRPSTRATSSAHHDGRSWVKTPRLRRRKDTTGRFVATDLRGTSASSARGDECGLCVIQRRQRSGGAAQQRANQLGFLWASAL